MLTADWRGNEPYFINVTSQRAEFLQPRYLKTETAVVNLQAQGDSLLLQLDSNFLKLTLKIKQINS